MGGSTQSTDCARSLRLIAAAVCILLIVLFGAVQAAHIHADCADTHASCSLCASAHVAVELIQAPAAAPGAQVLARLEALPPAVPPSGFTAFSHFTRPPPKEALPA